MIRLQNLSKKYLNEWIFRGLSLEIDQHTAIIGANGSGKSTLLKVLTGILPPTEGKIDYLIGQKTISNEDIFRHIAWAAPYQELIEEFTMEEMVLFHQKFKKMYLSPQQIAQETDLERAWHRPIKFFSSGMKQKLKLALAFFSDTPILLLDEPSSNLDQKNIAWYQTQILQQKHRLILIASNQRYEYELCTQKIEIDSFKNLKY